MPNIEALAQWAAANVDTDREQLQLCMAAAEAWLAGAGVPVTARGPLYDLAVYQLATHYLDNKGVIAEGNAAQIPMGVMSMVHQLRLEGGDGA